ncbi:hypothetical protein [Roseateles sp. MS654]|uniref:hypothetical protein n=1 Tax=Roseateles sp. MS654 TaxID=3412685 RepID=UPI003C2D29F5
MPEPSVGRSWRTIERRLSQLDGFGLLVVFVQDAAQVGPLRHAITAWAQARERELVVLAERERDDFAVRMLTGLYEALAHRSHPLLWIEAHREAGDAAWDEQRARLLNRLNEQRGRLEAEAGPLVLLMPADFLRQTIAFAQDLWHARYLSLELTAEAGEPAAASSAPRSPPAFADLKRARGPLDVTTAIAHWDAAIGPRLASADDVRAGALRDLWLPDVAGAVRQAVRDDRWPAASLMADRLVSLARARVAAFPGVAGVTVARDLVRALQAAGYVRWSAGAIDEAVDYYREAVDVCRASLKAAPDDRHGVLLLAQLLDEYALLCERRDDLVAARLVAEEAVTLRRRLIEVAGREHALLAELATGLEGAAHAYRRSGNLARASLALTEAVAARREALHQEDDPASRRRLADALLQLGEIKLLEGDFDDAVAAQSESVAVRRAMVEEVHGDDGLDEDVDDVDDFDGGDGGDGDDGDVDGDRTDDAELALMIGLDALAVAAAAAGDRALSDRSWDESIAIARARLQADGPTRAALDILGERLVSRISVEPARNAELHAELHAEARRIYSQLAERFPESPLYASILQELARPTLA